MEDRVMDETPNVDEALPPHLMAIADEVIELLRARGLKCAYSGLVLTECYLRVLSHLHKTGVIDLGEIHKHADEASATARKMIMSRITTDGGMH